MRSKFWLFGLILMFAVLTACGSSDENEDKSVDENGELKALEVEFEVPETADVDETIELKTVVTYGDELVKDADEMNFEYWQEGDKDNSTTIESTNNGDGSYTAEVAFEQDGVFVIYAHTTARTMHTMPKRSITIGEGAGAEPDSGNAEHDAEGQQEHVEGFGMHFMEPENVKVNEETELMVHLQMNQDPFEKAAVRYEIWNDADSEEREWLDAEESEAGEYVATHTFTDADTYTVQIHVKDDEGLHEHEEYDIKVNE